MDTHCTQEFAPGGCRVQVSLEEIKVTNQDVRSRTKWVVGWSLLLECESHGGLLFMDFIKRDQGMADL